MEGSFTEFFKFSNPLFLDAFVAVVLYSLGRLLAWRKFPRVAEGIREASLVFIVFMFYDASRYFALDEEYPSFSSIISSSISLSSYHSYLYVSCTIILHKFFLIPQRATAKENGLRVINFEKATHIDIEKPLQRFAMTHQDFGKFLNHFYLGAHWYVQSPPAPLYSPTTPSPPSAYTSSPPLHSPLPFFFLSLWFSNLAIQGRTGDLFCVGICTSYLCQPKQDPKKAKRVCSIQRKISARLICILY